MSSNAARHLFVQRHSSRLLQGRQIMDHLQIRWDGGDAATSRAQVGTRTGTRTRTRTRTRTTTTTTTATRRRRRRRRMRERRTRMREGRDLRGWTAILFSVAMSGGKKRCKYSYGWIVLDIVFCHLLGRVGSKLVVICSGEWGQNLKNAEEQLIIWLTLESVNQRKYESKLLKSKWPKFHSSTLVDLLWLFIGLKLERKHHPEGHQSTHSHTREVTFPFAHKGWFQTVHSFCDSAHPKAPRNFFAQLENRQIRFAAD